MQKKLLAGKNTEIAKGYDALIIDGRIEIYPKDGRGTLYFDDKETKIEVFETQIKEWFLNRAYDLLANEDNDFIVVMICCSYIDSMQQYREGASSDGRVRRFFIASLKRIVPNKEDNTYTKIYESTRCGLFHNGMVKENIRITRDLHTECISDPDEDNIIKINPELFLQEIQKDFDKYLDDLRSENSVHYENFKEMFKFE